MSAYERKTTNSEFAKVLTLLRERAREHGLNPNDYNLARFLLDVAETASEDIATIRHLYNLLHPQPTPV